MDTKLNSCEKVVIVPGRSLCHSFHMLTMISVWKVECAAVCWFGVSLNRRKSFSLVFPENQILPQINVKVEDTADACSARRCLWAPTPALALV